MKNMLLVPLVFLYSLTYSQESIYVKGKDYDGYIFKENHFVFMSVENQRKRYTLSKDDITQVEKILKDSIGYILKNQQHHQISLNKKTLKKYKRQYVGFLTSNNDILVWINFLRSKNISNKELSNDIMTVYDEGANYWSIFLNLIEKKTI